MGCMSPSITPSYMVLKWTKAPRGCSLTCIFSSGGHHFPVQWHLSTYSLPSRSLIRDGSWTMPPSTNCDKVGRWSSRAKHGKGGEGKSRIGAERGGRKTMERKGSKKWRRRRRQSGGPRSLARGDRGASLVERGTDGHCAAAPYYPLSLHIVTVVIQHSLHCISLV